MDRLPDLLDRCELLLLLDLRDGCGETWLSAVVGRDSGDLLLGDNRLIQPGDNLSIVDVEVGCMTRSDIDVIVSRGNQIVLGMRVMLMSSDRLMDPDLSGYLQGEK